MSAAIYQSGRRLALGAATTGVHWIGAEALLALGDGSVLAASQEGDARRIGVHDGAILSVAPHPDGKRLLTGGDDGAVRALAPSSEIAELLTGRKWIDHLVASASSDVIVAAAGKEAIVFRNDKEAHRFTYGSTVGGLALDTKGRKLAATHYGGASMRYALMADDKGASFKWAGSHLGCTLSPDGDYLVTAMQENALHGWRLADKTDLRMDGYPSKTRSFSWDKSGRWLATSGADSAVVWPFVGKLGPQGKAPLQLIPREALVTAVAFHPANQVLAIGYSDGAVWLAEFATQGVREIDEAGEGAVAGLGWSADGRQLAWGDEAGRGGIALIT